MEREGEEGERERGGGGGGGGGPQAGYRVQQLQLHGE